MSFILALPQPLFWLALMMALTVFMVLVGLLCPADLEEE